MRFSALFVALSLILPTSASATLVQYELSGTTAAPLGTPVGGSSNFIVDWEGVVLSYNDFGTASFADDLVTLSGTLEACFGNTACRGNTDFAAAQKYKPKSYYIDGFSGDSGTYEVNASFGVDPNLTTGSDNFYAQMGDIGSAEMTEQRTEYLPNRQRRLVGHETTDLDLALKNNPDLGWAFHLFDDAPLGDGRYRIETWIAMSGLILNGTVRHETRVIERVFNGDLFATRIGDPEGPVTPPTEVPEPVSSALLLTGLGGLLHRKHKAKASA